MSARRRGPSATACWCTSEGRSRTGFQILEIWESQRHFARFNDEVVDPVMGQMFEGPLPDLPTPVEFEVRGLVLPSADLLI